MGVSHQKVHERKETAAPWMLVTSILSLLVCKYNYLFPFSFFLDCLQRSQREETMSRNVQTEEEKTTQRFEQRFLSKLTEGVEAIITLVADIEAKQDEILQRESATPEKVANDVDSLLTMTRVIGNMIVPILAQLGMNQYRVLLGPEETIVIQTVSSEDEQAMNTFKSSIERLRSRTTDLVKKLVATLRSLQEQTNP
jgi:hypothetical protein